MWKPGTAKPDTGKKSSSGKEKKSKKSTAAPPLQMPNTPSAPKELTPKKLSGATMNMRFMKRKQERQEQEQQCKRLSTGGNSSAPSTSTPEPQRTSAPLVQPVDETSSRDHGSDAVDMDVDLDQQLPQSSRNGLPYQVATPIDMYDMQASLIGRRSFGGFNLAMEEAWKQCQDTLQDRTSPTKNSKKISDEELIERYQEIVNKRSESSRPVGNLRDKATPKRQRRSSK